MDLREFIERLNESLAGRIIENQGLLSTGKDLGISGLPGILGEYKGYGIRVDFLSPGELILEIYAGDKTPLLLQVMHESVVSKFLDKLHLSAEIKIGVREFDEKYKIQKSTLESARKTLNPDFRSVLMQLEPFAAFEITNNTYKVLKYVKPGFEYYPDRAVTDLETLIKLVELNKKTWSK
ncbi:hypothetical protein JXI42_10305 [bacterium]|nr:hypothetical protein [bacterium]